MAIQIQLRQGTTTEHNTFKGAVGEVTVDTTKKTVVVHDGVTLGGTVLAKVSEVPSLIPQATETALGVAKIATTSIAQAGTNDTDFLTAKKLRDALNAEGDAPVFGFRALVTFNAKTTPPTILRSKNVLSVTQNATGDWTITFETALPNENYGVFGSATDGASSSGSFKVRSSTNDSAGAPMLKTTNQVRVAYGFASSFISVGVV